VFAAGAVAAFRLPRGTQEARQREAPGEWRKLLSARLLAGGIAMAGSRAAVGYLTFLLAFLLRAAGESGRGFAVVVAAAGIGGFAGSVVAPLLRAVLRESALLLVTLAGMTAAALWAAGDFDVTRAAVLAGAAGLGSGAGRLAFDSLLQHDAPEAVRGRTFARYETIFQLWWVAGATVATFVPLGAAAGMRVLAGVYAVTAVLSVRGLARRDPDTGGRCAS